MEGIGKNTTIEFKNKQVMTRTLTSKIEQASYYLEKFNSLQNQSNFKDLENLRISTLLSLTSRASQGAISRQSTVNQTQT